MKYNYISCLIALSYLLGSFLVTVYPEINPGIIPTIFVIFGITLANSCMKALT